MQDFQSLGSGNSRYLKSVSDFLTRYPTYEDMAAALVAGTLPIDLNGYNADGINQRGTPYNKANVLTDATAALLGLDANATPNDAFKALAGGSGSSKIVNCESAADSTEKIITISGKYPGKGAEVTVCFVYGNEATGNLYLTVNYDDFTLRYIMNTNRVTTRAAEKKWPPGAIVTFVLHAIPMSTPTSWAWFIKSISSQYNNGYQYRDTYKGTGSYGSSNANTIPIDVYPVLGVIIKVGSTDIAIVSNGCMVSCVDGVWHTLSESHGTTSGLSFYSTESAAAQMNTNGAQYTYGFLAAVN